jgi:flagellar L-ring protein precursor FlgH
MNASRFTLLAAILALLSGCASQPNLMPSAEFAPVQPLPDAQPKLATGGIFANGQDLFGDLRSYQPSEIKVGDLITVLLNETTQASRSSAMSTSRESSNDAIGANQRDSIAGNVIEVLGRGTRFFSDLNTAGANITSEGSGTAGQQASLTGSISAMVVEVLANGNLVIVGEKQLALTEGTEFIRIKGIIRPADIQPDNTILSQRIAHAQIAYRGTGNLASASKTSWGNRLLYKLWPF